MELHEIKRMVYGGESETVEFKRKVSHPEKVIREVVAFANTRGGYLLVGVDDDKTIYGVKDVEEEDFIMQKALKELCRPQVTCETTIFQVNEKRALICYRIEPSQHKPHYAFEKKNHRYGKAFVRVADRSIQASPEVRKILKFNNKPSDVQFAYGESEQQLFHYLKDHDHITLEEFKALTGLNYKSCSQILIKMVLANVLKIVPREAGDYYLAVE